MNKFPTYINNWPCGEDKFEGQSQIRIAEAISKHITNIDSAYKENQISKIIGLEGGWGVGKSNVLKLLTKNLPSNYKYFEYDTWGHQEDLQRRTFLESLTEFLLRNKILIKHSELSSKENDGNLDWDEKLRLLLAKKIITEKKSIPLLNGGALFTAIFLALTPISLFIADKLSELHFLKNIFYISIIGFSPIVLGIIIWFITMIFKKETRNLGYLFQLYRNEDIRTKHIETINEDEPSVVQFKEWMKEISKNLGLNECKLVIVYDNMDRLPANKVRELWSSIYTFFSETRALFDNIWVIIPFDIKHLSCSFGEDADKSSELTKQFISKTFPIVFRVAQPVVSDQKSIFKFYFYQAFGEKEVENEKFISRIYRLEHSNTTVREVIYFINQLVSLKNIWEDEISLKYIGIFNLYKDKILCDPVNYILSGEYLNKRIEKIIPNNEELQRNISALTYEISIKYAEQLPLNKYILNCINNSNYDINKYINNDHFFNILEDVINESDLLDIEKIVNMLSQIKINNLSEVQSESITQAWKIIASLITSSKINSLEFSSMYEQILRNVRNYAIEQRIVNHLCTEFYNYPEFNGESFFYAISSLDDYIKKNSKRLKINIFEKNINNTEFIEYVLIAEHLYSEYRITTDFKDLDIYISKILPKDFVKARSIIYVVNNENYSFPHTLKSIEKIVEISKEITKENFSTIFTIYKCLSKQKPLLKKLDITVKRKLAEINSEEDQLNILTDIDFISMSILDQKKFTNYINYNSIPEIARNIEFYHNYDDLLISTATRDNSLLIKVVKHMIDNNMGENLSLKKVFPYFNEIRKATEVSEVDFINHLNKWHYQVKDEIKPELLRSIIPLSVFRYLNNKQTNLINQIVKISIQAIKTINERDIIDEINQYNFERSYWIKLSQYLIQNDKIEELPENFVKVGNKVLYEIAIKSRPIPNINHPIHSIFSKLRSNSTVNTISNILNYYISFKSHISCNIFIFLEEFLFLSEKLYEYPADSVVEYIISPVFSDDRCFNRIISRKNYYTEIIIKSKIEVKDIKSVINRNLKRNKNSLIVEFAKNIGV